MDSGLRVCEDNDRLAQLYAAISDAIADVKPVLENATADPKVGGYSYADHSAILNAVRAPMTKHGLSLFPVRTATESFKNTKGSIGLRLHITYRITHRAGGWDYVVGIGDGMDSRDKSPYIAQTGALKYVLRQLFALVVSDDPERYNESEEEADWFRYRNQINEQGVDELAFVACVVADRRNRDAKTPANLNARALVAFWNCYINGDGRHKYDKASAILAEALEKIAALTQENDAEE